MRTIWKFDVPLQHNVILQMPAGAKLLTVQMQGHKPCLWAELSDQQPTEERLFVWCETGQQMPHRPMSYIGTVQQECYVWHLYEVVKP